VLFFLLWSNYEIIIGISVKFMSNVLIVNRSSLEMPAAGVLLQQYQRNT
jgi:hypothetical protein